jgi:hypothetical protein
MDSSRFAYELPLFSANSVTRICVSVLREQGKLCERYRLKSSTET